MLISPTDGYDHPDIYPDIHPDIHPDIVSTTRPSTRTFLKSTRTFSNSTRTFLFFHGHLPCHRA